jgi:hypothetical protein
MRFSVYPNKKFGAYQDDRSDFLLARVGYENTNVRCAEAEIMDWADDMAYALHDVEDCSLKAALEQPRLGAVNHHLARGPRPVNRSQPLSTFPGLLRAPITVIPAFLARPELSASPASASILRSPPRKSFCQKGLYARNPATVIAGVVLTANRCLVSGLE